MGQMTPCCAPPCPNPPSADCNVCDNICSNCMEVEVENFNMPCDLNLYWGYAGCSYIQGYSSPIPSSTTEVKNGPCAKCPGDNTQCECPNRIFVSISATQQWWPWGDFSTVFLSGNKTFILNAPFNNLCPGCTFGVKVEVQISGTNHVKLIFSCI